MSNFSMIPNWVIRDSDLDAHELLVYLALLNRADRTGKAWPSKSTLAKEARCSERTVNRTLEKLKRRRLVTVKERPQEGGRHLPNLYTVAVFDLEKPKRQTGVHSATQRGARSPAEGRTVHPEVVPNEVDPLEVDMRSDLPDRTRPGFSFPAAEPEASRKQRTYVRDLWIHYYGEVPSEAQEQEFARLTSAQASAWIAQLLRDMPRYDAYVGPEPGDDAYEALSDTGKEWADRGMLPEAVAA